MAVAVVIAVAIANTVVKRCFIVESGGSSYRTHIK